MVVGDECYAIDPTGAHILEGKIRGKLMAIDKPKIVLITPGKIKADWSSLESESGFTIARPRRGRMTVPEHVPDLRAALNRIADIKD